MTIQKWKKDNDILSVVDYYEGNKGIWKITRSLPDLYVETVKKFSSEERMVKYLTKRGYSVYGEKRYF